MTSFYVTLQDIHDLKQGFEERIGDPTRTSAALGKVFIGFSWLEGTVEGHLQEQLGLPDEMAQIIMAEMSYKNKIAALSGVVLKKISSGHRFNCGEEDPLDAWKDFLKMLHACEEIRNRLAHSSWKEHSDVFIATLARAYEEDTGKRFKSPHELTKADAIMRRKVTAKAAKGLQVMEEEYTSGQILDMYDYFLNVLELMNDFFYSE